MTEEAKDRAYTLVLMCMSITANYQKAKDAAKKFLPYAAHPDGMDREQFIQDLETAIKDLP